MAIRSMSELAPLIDRVRELAAAEVPAPRTLDLTCWEDGDFSLRVYHTHPDGRETVRYRQGMGEVQWRRVHERAAGLEREERVLARIDEATLLGQS
jgi:hypothetical protein